MPVELNTRTCSLTSFQGVDTGVLDGDWLLVDVRVDVEEAEEELPPEAVVLEFPPPSPPPSPSPPFEPPPRSPWFALQYTALVTSSKGLC